MHILTSDRLTKNQLSLLLRELGYAPTLHSDVASLRKALQECKPLTTILIDLLHEIPDDDLKAIQTFDEELNLIGFERFDKNTRDEDRIPATTFSTSLIIPSHTERAKFRLKNAVKARKGTSGLLGNTTRGPFPGGITRAPFKGGNTRTPSKLTRPPFKFNKADASKRPFPKISNPLSNNDSNPTPRYLTVRSRSSEKLFEKLRSSVSIEGFLILEAVQDAEFEIICRELNYLTNSDTETLHILQPENIRIDHLEKLERQANKSKIIINCYVGRTDELDTIAASELRLFGEFLCNLRNPHLRLILGHELGSESYYRHGVSEHLTPINLKATRIVVPSLKDRPEDIPVICQQTLSNLRTVHPFLSVQRISKDAEDYLSEHRSDFSYTKLVRILRNAVALSKRSTLSVEDIKNYGESDITTQHLLETMADECYFPQSANF
ncbi:MAG: hypothetical protein ACSHYA_10335 [Opitutaceae bacterium]